jgi:hypothetical protein
MESEKSVSAVVDSDRNLLSVLTGKNINKSLLLVFILISVKTPYYSCFRNNFHIIVIPARCN